jgi:hypothetical protein
VSRVWALTLEMPLLPAALHAQKLGIVGLLSTRNQRHSTARRGSGVRPWSVTITRARSLSWIHLTRWRGHLDLIRLSLKHWPHSRTDHALSRLDELIAGCVIPSWDSQPVLVDIGQLGLIVPETVCI